MSFKCVCPECGAVIEAIDDWLGQRRPCEKCGNQVLIRKDRRLSQLGLNADDDSDSRFATRSTPSPPNESLPPPAPQRTMPKLIDPSNKTVPRQKPSLIPNESKPTATPAPPSPATHRQKPSLIPNEPKPSAYTNAVGSSRRPDHPDDDGAPPNAPDKEDLKINKFRGRCPKCTRPMLNDGSPCLCGFSGDPTSLEDAENAVPTRGDGTYTEQHLRKFERFRGVKRKIQYATPFVAGVIGGVLGGIIGAILMLFILSALTAVVMAVLESVLFPYRPSGGKTIVTTTKHPSVNSSDMVGKGLGCLVLVVAAGLLWLALACLDHGNLGGTIPFGLFGVIFLIIGFKNLFGK